MRETVWDVKASKYIDIDIKNKTIAIRRKIKDGRYICYTTIDLNKHNEVPGKLLDKLVNHWGRIDDPDPKVFISASDYEVYCSNVNGVHELLINLKEIESKTQTKDAMLKLEFMWEDVEYSDHEGRAYDYDYIRLDRVRCRQLYRILKSLC